VSKFLRDSDGGVLVEFTLLAFPVFLLAAFGTVDFTYMLFDWSMANKAAFAGARAAVVSNPVASGITNVSYTATQIAALGKWCFNTGTGSANSNCPSPSAVCTPDASPSNSGTCTNGYNFDNVAFTCIFNPKSDPTHCQLSTYNPIGMVDIFPRLQRQNVQILYNANGLGFVGQPNGLPMDVTISIECMTHQFFFINGLMRWIWTAPSNYTNPSASPPPCPATTAGLPMPRFATTLTSESMVTN
jgi:hypothetical protein